MFLRRPCIFGVVPNGDFTDVEWDAVDDPPLVIKDSAISKQSPNGCPGRLSPHLARKGQCYPREVSMKQEAV